MSIIFIELPTSYNLINIMYNMKTSAEGGSGETYKK